MRKDPQYSSEALVQMIQGETQEKDKAITYIFVRNKDKTIGWLLSKGVNTEQAEDILQEGMLILIRQLKGGKYLGKNQASVHSYFVGICKHLLMAQRRKQATTLPLLDKEASPQEPSIMDNLEQEEQQMQLHQCLKQLGETCRKMLLLRASSPPVPLARTGTGIWLQRRPKRHEQRGQVHETTSPTFL